MAKRDDPQWYAYMVVNKQTHQYEMIGPQDECNAKADEMGHEWVVIPIRIKKRRWDKGEQMFASPGVKAQS